MGTARRTAFALLVAGLLAAAALIGTTTSPAPAAARSAAALQVQHRAKSGPCLGTGWATAPEREQPARVARLIRCAVARWPVPGGVTTAMVVSAHESGRRPRAYNPGGYAGVFQQAVRYWPGRARAALRARWFGGRQVGPFNARANVIVSIRMAHARGWCQDWPNTAPGC